MPRNTRHGNQQFTELMLKLIKRLKRGIKTSYLVNNCTKVKCKNIKINAYSTSQLLLTLNI